jgi:hypothetical protein
MQLIYTKPTCNVHGFLIFVDKLENRYFHLEWAIFKFALLVLFVVVVILCLSVCTSCQKHRGTITIVDANENSDDFQLHIQDEEHTEEVNKNRDRTVKEDMPPLEEDKPLKQTKDKQLETTKR